jgi:hypothetical protein
MLPQPKLKRPAMRRVSAHGGELLLAPRLVERWEEASRWGYSSRTIQERERPHRKSGGGVGVAAGIHPPGKMATERAERAVSLCGIAGVAAAGMTRGLFCETLDCGLIYQFWRDQNAKWRDTRTNLLSHCNFIYLD